MKWSEWKWSEWDSSSPPLGLLYATGQPELAAALLPAARPFDLGAAADAIAAAPPTEEAQRLDGDAFE